VLSAGGERKGENENVLDRLCDLSATDVVFLAAAEGEHWLEAGRASLSMFRVVSFCCLFIFYSAIVVHCPLAALVHDQY